MIYASMGYNGSRTLILNSNEQVVIKLCLAGNTPRKQFKDTDLAFKFSKAHPHRL